MRQKHVLELRKQIRARNEFTVNKLSKDAQESRTSEAERGPGPSGASEVPHQTDPEVSPHIRRWHTKAYKQSMVAKVDALKKSDPGSIRAYLRKEGLYYAAVHKWKKQLSDGLLSEVKRGTKASDRDMLVAENVRLKRQLQATQKKLERTELVVDLQKKISLLLSKVSEPEN